MLADPPRLDEELQKRLVSLVEDGNVAGIRSVSICIQNPSKRYVFEGAAGTARPDTGEAITPHHRCHIASVTKTMTAILILKLLERGRFGPAGLDTPIIELNILPRAIVSRLSAIDGRFFGDAITLRHLLNHTGGMKDAMVDDGSGTSATDGSPRPKSLIGQLFADPASYMNHMWQPWDPQRVKDPLAGTLNFYLNADRIADTALGQPGHAFHYSDTGYVVLALIAQALFGVPLHVALNKEIFEPLGLKNTYLAYCNDPELGAARYPEVEIYAGALPSFTSGYNFSFDWGGGGVVTTMPELNKFLIALAKGRLFRDPNTFRIMTEWVAPKGLLLPRIAVGCGVFKIQGPNCELWGHSGAWGTKMFFDPASGVFFTGTTNQGNSPADWHDPFINDVRQAIVQGDLS